MGDPKGAILGHEFYGTVINLGNRNVLKKGNMVTAYPISPCDHCSENTR